MLFYYSRLAVGFGIVRKRFFLEINFQKLTHSHRRREEREQMDEENAKGMQRPLNPRDYLGIHEKGKFRAQTRSPGESETRKI
jgi:hypothetical protein